MMMEMNIINTFNKIKVNLYKIIHVLFKIKQNVIYKFKKEILLNIKFEVFY